MVLCPPPVISANWRTSAGYLGVNLYLAENTLQKGQQHEKYPALFKQQCMSLSER